ncbi:hypothetical protein GQ53DRAFT_241046 [Thozetella sp. PMI_491]|nr:hypothetical protein GQ53DRAFT_241046 [Thozetella sp. PMI_491]
MTSSPQEHVCCCLKPDVEKGPRSEPPSPFATASERTLARRSRLIPLDRLSCLRSVHPLRFFYSFPAVGTFIWLPKAR